MLFYYIIAVNIPKPTALVARMMVDTCFILINKQVY